MQIKTRKSKLWNLLVWVLFPDMMRKSKGNGEWWLTFNQTIWCPEDKSIGGGPKISHDLIAHETVHCKQQKNFFYAIYWWVKYITNSKFRYSQELPAYRAQLSRIGEEYRDYETRRRFRVAIAGIMSDRYNKMVDFKKAFDELGQY